MFECQARKKKKRPSRVITRSNLKGLSKDVAQPKRGLSEDVAKSKRDSKDVAKPKRGLSKNVAVAIKRRLQRVRRRSGAQPVETQPLEAQAAQAHDLSQH